MTQAQDKPQDAISIDDLMETSLDDIEDLPEYLDFCPTGNYKLEIVGAEKEVVEVDDDENKGKKKDADVFRVQYEIVKINELKDPEQEDQIKTRELHGAGSRFSESFFMHKDPKKSMQIFKAKYKEIAIKFGFTTVSQLLDGMKGTVIDCNVKSNLAKDKERYFINTKNI